MGRARDRAERIRERIPIVQVLADYGYYVDPDGDDREQQFSCDLHGDGQDNKPSARAYPESGSFYCVSIHARVLTDGGWLKLDDIRRRRGRFCHGFEYLGNFPDSCGPRTYGCPRCGWVAPTVNNPQELAAIVEKHGCPSPWAPAMEFSPVNVLDGDAAWEMPNAYFRRGVRDVVHVKTKAGYQVVVTPNHEIEVVGKGWVRAEDIQPGDILVIPIPETPRFPEQKEDLPVEDLNRHVYKGHPPLQLPERWNTALGEVLGYVFGDGWVTPRKNPASGMVGLTSHASDVQDARSIFSHMQQWAAGRGSEVHRTDTSRINDKEYVQDQYVFTIGNDGFCEFFRRLGLDKSASPHERRLPESLWTAPECAVRGFLRGLYGADGSVFRPKGHKGVRVNLYSVSVEFLRDVQLLLLQFGVRSRLYAPSNTRHKTGKNKGKRTHPAAYLQLATGKDVCRFRERVGIANQRKQAVLESYEYNHRGAKPFKPVVESVEPAGRAHVADISMPVEHSFVAGGIKVHNCFACGKTRDAIQLTREKEGLDFGPACRLLENRYGLPPLPWDGTVEREATASEQIRDALRRSPTLEDEQRRVQRLLDNLTREKDLLLESTLGLWEAFDKIMWFHREGRIEDYATQEALQRLRGIIMDKLKEQV